MRKEAVSKERRAYHKMRAAAAERTAEEWRSDSVRGATRLSKDQ
jgi:hypothetical protein